MGAIEHPTLFATFRILIPLNPSSFAMLNATSIIYSLVNLLLGGIFSPLLLIK